MDFVSFHYFIFWGCLHLCITAGLDYPTPFFGRGGGDNDDKDDNDYDDDYNDDDNDDDDNDNDEDDNNNNNNDYDNNSYGINSNNNIKYSGRSMYNHQFARRRG